MSSATFTKWAATGTTSGSVLVFGGLAGSGSYTIGTGDNLAASACNVDSIVGIFPTPANGFIPMWDNSKQCLRIYCQTNVLTTNGVAFVESQSAVNFANITFPAIVIGTQDL